jgi:hypothetical protein
MYTVPDEVPEERRSNAFNDYGGHIRRLHGGIKTEKERHKNKTYAFGVFNPPLTMPKRKKYNNRSG